VGCLGLSRNWVARSSGLFISLLSIRAFSDVSFQHAFENLEDSAKDGIVDELLNQGTAVFSEVAKSQWGSYCIQHSRFSVSLCVVVMTLSLQSWSMDRRSTVR